MRRPQAIALAAVCLLGWLCASLSARILDHYQVGGTLVGEWGRTHLVTLEPETERALAALEERVSATYYVSAREHMPSHMRRVERRVTDLLAALAHAAPNRFDYQIVDPETDSELTGFAANRRIAPFRERSIRGDAYSERTIWSALALSFGTRPAAVLNGITPDVLPRLQGAIVAHLEALDDPRAPRFALASPAARGYTELAAALEERGTLRRIDLDQGDSLPGDVDVLFWMAPRRVSTDRLDELDRFLAGGSSLVVASNELAVDGQLLGGTDAEGTALRVRPSGADPGPLWSHLGLRARAGLFCDERADEVLAGDVALRAPFAIRCIAPNQDFRGFGRQPNGTLLFSLANPFATDGPTLERRGWRATVLATTSETTWSLAPPLEEPLSLAEMDAERELRLPKQPLIVELRPADPWHGRVVAMAAPTPFEDGVLHRSFNAHTPLLDTLLAGLAAPDRLVQNDVPRAAAEPLPKRSAGERLLWRAFVVFLLPALLLVSFLWTRGFGTSRRRAAVPVRGPDRPLPLRIVLGTLAVLIAGLVATRALGTTGLRADWSAEGTNTLAPATVALAAQAREGAPIEVLVGLPEESGLPPEWKPGVRRLERLLRELERAGAPLETRRVDPGDEGPLGSEAKHALQRRGLTAFEVASRAEEETTVRTLWSHLLLRRGERVEHVTFESERAFEEAEFRLSFALWRLLEERTVRLAFASDLPRLSAAEAHEDYQQKGLFAPSGTDVYSRARALLDAQGYDVHHIDPRDPGELESELEDGLETKSGLLVWMQPRRSIEPMLPLVARHLHGGGSLLLAAQHFNIQSRQYRGAGFELVYWPQPQSTDVERLYFPELGVELVREVVFDDLSTTLRTDTQITGRGAAKDFEEQTSALPFLLRVSAANMAAEPLTRGLGDQAFAWPSYLRLDAARLEELGLRATPLLSTSPRSWTYDWSGGWLPAEVLAGPAGKATDPQETPTTPAATPASGDSAAIDRPHHRGRLPLAALIEGRFPKPESSLRLDGELADEEDPRPWPSPAPGRLVVVGASHPFQDAQLSDETFRSDQLLSNLVANLALPADLAAVAARRQVSRGLDYVAPETKLVWRAAVMLGGPLALLVGALAWVLLRRGSSAATSGPPSDSDRTGANARGGSA